MKQQSVYTLAMLTGLVAASSPAIGSECCPADFTGDGMVNTEELLGVISGWGPCSGGPDECPMDIDGSGTVGVDDLLAVLTGWGMCPDHHDHGEYIVITDWGNFHDSNDNSHHHQMVGGRTAITTEGHGGLQQPPCIPRSFGAVL